GDQAHPTVAIDADGDFIVAWQSGGGQDGSGYGVFARRYGATGTAIGEEIRANATTDSDQTDPSVAADAAANFVIAWWNQAGSPTFKGGPRAQMYDASGAPRGQEIIADSAVIDEQSMPSVAMSQSGDWIITWQSANQDGSGWGIYGQRYDRTGTRQGTEVQIN